MNHIVPQGPVKRSQHFIETYRNIQRLDCVVRCAGADQKRTASKMLQQKFDHFKTWFNTIQNVAICFRPLQNNNVKSPKFASSESGNPDGKKFNFPFGNRVDAVYIHFAEGKVWRRIRRQLMHPFPTRLLNLFTSKIWLLILLSSCYTFPC